MLGVHLASGESAQAIHTAAVFVSFFAGCVISGLIIKHSALRSGYPYGSALVLESALLVAAACLFNRGAAAGTYFAAMACGLQNAMATTYSGAVIRTTHVTGIVTDLGIAVGQVVRREQVDRRRFGLYLVLLAGFFIGGIAGSAGFLILKYNVLFFPAAFTGCAGIGYFISTHTSAGSTAPARR
jgi:uncharacterized membrane protein YoaK (UPF0700 family)